MIRPKLSRAPSERAIDIYNNISTEDGDDQSTYDNMTFVGDDGSNFSTLSSTKPLSNNENTLSTLDPMMGRIFTAEDAYDYMSTLDTQTGSEPDMISRKDELGSTVNLVRPKLKDVSTLCDQ